MLGFSMEVMDMVLAMLVLVMLELDTVILPMDTMVRDLLMLSQRLRLMQDFFMEDMGLALDMVMAMVLDTVDTTMDKPLAKCLSKSSKATLMSFGANFGRNCCNKFILNKFLLL